MRLIAGLGGPGSRQYFFEITEDMMISFFEWPEVGSVPDKDPGRPVKGPFVFDHICITLGGKKNYGSSRTGLKRQMYG